MNEVFERSIKDDDKITVEFDKDKLLDIPKLLPLLPDNLKNRFIESYLWLRLSVFWSGLHIAMVRNTAMLGVYVSSRKELSLVLSLNHYTPDFFYKQLKDFCLALGVVCFSLREKQIFLEYSYSHTNKSKDADKILNMDILKKDEYEDFLTSLDEHIVFEIDIWQKESFLTRRKVRDIILSYYSHISAIQPTKQLVELPILVNSICTNFANSNFIDEKTQEFINKTPFCSKLKTHLISNGLINKDFSVKTGKSFKEARLEASNYFKNHYLKAKCPICGREYVKDRKDKTTCGNYNCKVLKNRIKEKMGNCKDMSKEECYSQMVKVNKQRISINKQRGKKYQNITDLKKLSGVLFNEKGQEA